MSGGKPYQYSAEDIRRYQEGQMSASEMHAIERASLDDPFLADAMEGFETATPSMMQSDMDNLRQRLQQKVTPAKVIPMQPQRPWMAIAAASVILLGLAITLLNTERQPENPVIAQVEKPASTQPAPAAQADSAVALATTPAASTAKTPEPQKDSKPDLSGSVAGVITTPATDSIKNQIASASESKANKPAALEETVENNKIDKETTARMKAVVPAAAPAQEKAKKFANSGRIYTEPSDGWSAWEVYVLNNLRKPKDPVIHGNVVVSFTVNPDTGKPYELKIDKSLHPLYDKEAIRLIKEGPGWTVYNTEGPVKTTYTVVF